MSIRGSRNQKVESRLTDFDSRNQVMERRVLNIEDKLQRVDEGVNTFKSEIARMAVQVSQLHDLVYRSFNRVDREEGNGKEILGSAPARTSSSLGPPRQQGYQPPATKVFTEESLHQNQKRQEDIPIQRLTAAEMAARREKGLCYCCDEVYKFGHQCTKRQIFMFKEEEESDDEEEENTEIATYLVKSQEATIEATSEAKNTNPWPDEPPKHIEHNLRSSSEETRKLTHCEDEDEASNGGEASPDSKQQQKRSVGQFRVFPVTDQAPILAEPVPPSSVLFLLLYDFQNLKDGKIPPNNFQKIKNRIIQLMVFQVAESTWDQFQHRSVSSSSRAAVAVANETNSVRLRTTNDVSVAFKQLHTVHCNSWKITTASTSSPDLYRLRSRPETQLKVLPVFDSGGFRSKEDEARISFDFNGYLGYFGRILDESQRRTKVSGRRFGERRRIGIFRMGIKEEEILGVILVEKVKDLGVVLMEACRKKVEVCALLKKKLRLDPWMKMTCLCAFWNIRYSDSLVKVGQQQCWVNQILGKLGYCNCQFLQCCWAFFLETRSIAPNAGQQLRWARSGKDRLGCIAITNSFRFWRFEPQHIWAIIAINFPFQFLGKLGHYFKLPSLRTRILSREMECKD